MSDKTDIRGALATYHQRAQEKFNLQEALNKQLSNLGYSFLCVQDNLYTIEDMHIYLVSTYNEGYFTIPVNEHSAALIYQGLPCDKLNAALKEYADNARQNGLAYEGFYANPDLSKEYVTRVRDHLNNLSYREILKLLSPDMTYTAHELYTLFNENFEWGLPSYADFTNGVRRAIGNVISRSTIVNLVFVLDKATARNPSTPNRWMLKTSKTDTPDKVG